MPQTLETSKHSPVLTRACAASNFNACTSNSTGWKSNVRADGRFSKSAVRHW